MESRLELLRLVEQALGLKLGDETGMLLLSTSLAVIVGLLVFLSKRSGENRSREVRQVIVPRPVSLKDEEEDEDIGPDKVKVTVFFGTQTGTAEGFAKVSFSREIDGCFILSAFRLFKIPTSDIFAEFSRFSCVLFNVDEEVNFDKIPGPLTCHDQSCLNSSLHNFDLFLAESEI